MDYPRFYDKISAPWRRLKSGPALLAWLNKLLVAVFAGSYGVALLWLAAQGDARLLRFVLVPAATFVLVSALRAWLNHPRPYERHDIDPIVPGSTQGKSMPSRHMTSATAIACALGSIDVRWGAALGVLACLVAYVRVVQGQHFPRDVVAGAAFALACAGVGYFAF